MIPATTIFLANTAAATAAPSWLAPAVFAAVITAVVAVGTLVVNGRRARVDRQRVLFAQALGHLAAYREFVYIAHRRRHDEPEAERVRISTELSKVQRRLNQHSAVLKVEAPRVAAAFDKLLSVTRRVAGQAIHDGWDTPPITDDSKIHVDIDLTAIDADEATYITAVRDHLSAVPGVLRRFGRGTRRGIRHRRASGAVVHSPTAVAEPVA